MIASVAAVTALAAAVLGLLAFRRAYAVVTVDGPSMEPTLHDGDRLLVSRRRRPRRGDVVVVRYPGRVLPGRPWTVKRVAAAAGDPVPAAVGLPEPMVPAGRLVVLGDNAERSHDSRGFGYADADQVLGVLVRRVTARRVTARPAPR